jgi:RNA polymerase sigma factor (sigma-70 family)
MPIDSNQLLNFLAMECRFARLDGDEDNAHNFWNLLDKPLREAIRYRFARHSEQDDLVQVAVEDMFKKIGFFDPKRSSFVTWAKMQVYSAKAHYLRNTGYSRTMAGHIKLIREAMEKEFPNGPKPDQTRLELAREHVSKISSSTNLSKNEVLEALTAWGIEEAADSANYPQIADPKDKFQSQFTIEYLELAMSRLDQRSRTFVIQTYSSGLNYAEVAEKYNLTKSVSERTMTPEYARKIVSLAIKKLRAILDEMDLDDEKNTNEL